MPGAGRAGGRGWAPRPPQRKRSPASLQGGEREGDAGGGWVLGCCQVELVERLLRLVLCGPRGAEIESVGGNCREVRWGQYKEDSSSHQSYRSG